MSTGRASIGIAAEPHDRIAAYFGGRHRGRSRTRLRCAPHQGRLHGGGGVTSPPFPGVNGTLLLIGIVSLLFVEEVGVPLPFAPGDVLLGLGGAAIAAGRINPALFITAALTALLGGAVLGRELFWRLGWRRLLRVARWCHAGRLLERAASLLQRRGWRAVFIGRLIPGLRICTTQVAGVTGIPRGSFYLGLAPATAIYAGVFIGLGVVLEDSAIDLIRRGDRLALFAIVAAVLVGLVLWLLNRRRSSARGTALTARDSSVVELPV
jgi:membrane protein DedA with SNARE-associated domain